MLRSHIHSHLDFQFLRDTSHCHGNHESWRDKTLGVIAAAEASTRLAVDTDMDVYVYHKCSAE